MRNMNRDNPRSGPRPRLVSMGVETTPSEFVMVVLASIPRIRIAIFRMIAHETLFPRPVSRTIGPQNRAGQSARLRHWMDIARSLISQLPRPDRAYPPTTPAGVRARHKGRAVLSWYLRATRSAGLTPPSRSRDMRRVPFPLPVTAPDWLGPRRFM